MNSDHFTIEPVALLIVSKAYHDSCAGVPLFGSQQGTALGITLTCKDGFITDLDASESNLSAFTDDTGTDLRRNRGYIWAARASEDRRVGLVEIRSNSVPNVGANAVIASGVIRVATASEKQVVRSDVMRVEEGATGTADGLDFTISEIPPATYEPYGLRVTLEFKTHLRNVRETRFEDVAGEPLGFRLCSSGGVSIGDETTYRETYEFNRRPDEFVVVFEKWIDRKECDLPFTVQASLGFGT